MTSRLKKACEVLVLQAFLLLQYFTNDAKKNHPKE